MKMRNRTYLSILLLICVSSLTFAQTRTAGRHPYSSEAPLNEPTVFNPGIISAGDYESHPAFTPDGRTLYFLKNSPDFSFWTIVVSHFRNGRWSKPEVAPFSGRYSDADPFITADGSKLYFISNRPLDQKGEAKGDLDIWVMEKTNDGWGPPKNMGPVINSDGNEWYPTLSANGTLYFGSDRANGKGRTDIYRAPLKNGNYEAAENLGAEINTQFNEFEPLIANDESFLIFMAGGRADGLGGFDLYISHNRNGAWTKPVNLGNKVNSTGNELSPTISPDGKYFFWTSTRSLSFKSMKEPMTYADLERKLRSPQNGLGDIYQIDLKALKLEP